MPATVGRLVLTSVAATLLSGRMLAATVSYDSLVVFGHSWTDTARNPATGDYWKGRYSNGPLWVEYLSTNLGFAYAASKNFAVSGATSADVLKSQIPLYHATTNAVSPLFVVWAYEGDFGAVIFGDGGSGLGRNLTNETFWSNIVQRVVLNTSNSIAALYTKGARAVVVPNMIGYEDFLGNGSYYKVPDSTRKILAQRSTAVNESLVRALNAIEEARPDIRLFRLDFHSLIHTAVVQHLSLGFTKATISALDDTSLADKSFTGVGEDYLWWDQLHPTTKFHQLWAGWIYDLVTKSALEKLELTTVESRLDLRMRGLRPNRAYIIQGTYDLRLWEDLSSFVASAGTNSLSWGATSHPASFYRLHWEN